MSRPAPKHPKPGPTTMYVIEMREPSHPIAYILAPHGQWFPTMQAAEDYISNMHPTMHLDKRKYAIRKVIVGKKNACEIQS